VHKAYKRTVGTVILKIESVDAKLQSQHVELLYDNKHNNYLRKRKGKKVTIRK